MEWKMEKELGKPESNVCPEAFVPASRYIFSFSSRFKVPLGIKCKRPAESLNIDF